MPSTRTHCPTCAKPVAKSAKFCPNCGQSVAVGVQPSGQELVVIPSETARSPRVPQSKLGKSIGKLSDQANDIAKQALETDIGKEAAHLAGDAADVGKRFVQTPLGKSMTVGAAIGAALAVPIPVVGPIVGGTVGAALGALSNFTRRR